MVNVGLVGFGYWGENLARNITRNPEANLVGLNEFSGARCELFRRYYPNAIITHYDELLKKVDAVVIATPPATHYKLARQALLVDKHVMVEKPMCLSSGHCMNLLALAEERSLTLAVDHTFVHTPAVAAIKYLISMGEIGNLLYYDSARVNLGTFQQDCDVIWDLAVHDLAIIDYLLMEKERPTRLAKSVSCRAFSHYKNLNSDQAFINVEYPDLNVHLNISWASPVKLRHTMIAGSKKMIVYDDIEPDEKIKIYDKSIDFNLAPEESAWLSTVSYRVGDIQIPKLWPANVEGLALSFADFIQAIKNKTAPKTDGYAGLRVVHLLENISKSAASNGIEVIL